MRRTNVHEVCYMGSGRMGLDSIFVQYATGDIASPPVVVDEDPYFKNSDT